MTEKVLHDFLSFRKFAEPKMDEAMARIDPRVAWCFDYDGTPHLMDTEKQRLLLDQEPTIAQAKCLMGFREECRLRGCDSFRFEFNGELYCHQDGRPFQRYTWNENALEWKCEEIPFSLWNEVEQYIRAHTITEEDRAARAAEDMRRVSEGMGKKPTGKVEE
jgi:hypothetical protein